MWNPASWNRAEDQQRAPSGMQTHVEHEVGAWDLAVTFADQPCRGALHFVGRLDGTLTLSIETPEERMLRF